MNNFNITITETIIGAETVNAVNARELHAELGYNSDNYAKWIKLNLIDSRFALNYDYIALHHKTSNKYDFLITFDTAKHLSMLARTKKGYNIRQYFIDSEKELRSIKQVCTMAEYNALLERVKLLEQQPKVVEYFTMREYLTNCGLTNIPTKIVMLHGSECTQYCHENNIMIRKEYHNNISSNLYPLHALIAWASQS